MVKIRTVAALMVLSVFLIPANAAIQSLEIRGQAANETAGVKGYLDLSGGSVSWQPQNFAGFFHDATDELGSEKLTILDSGSLNSTRTIQLDRLIYTTRGDNKFLLVVQNAFNGNYTQASGAGLREFQAGSMSSEDGKYRVVGWQGEKYVAIKNKTNKLTRLVIEHRADASDKKTLLTGEKWDIGGGWSLNATEINVTASPRYARLNLSKDGIPKTESIVYQGNILTYVESSIAGETNIPLFVTYVDAVFEGATTNMAQLRYTWALNTSISEIRGGDRYGVFMVQFIDPFIQMNNTDTVTLSRDTTVDLMGSMKFRVADSDTLRFYPLVGLSAPGMYEVRGQIANETAGTRGYLDLSGGSVSWQPQNFAGFFYDVNYEHGNEKLTVLNSGSLKDTRTILQDDLIYTTQGDNKLLNVVKYPFNGNYPAAEAAGLLQFQAGSMSSEAGKFKIVGWQGEKYVAIKNITNKLTRLIIEQGAAAAEKKTLAVGETWDIGNGWSLTAQAIDAKASPRQAWFVLSKDGIKKDDRVLAQGQIYTYVEPNIAGEFDVPLFVTYLDSVFAGANSDMAQVRYTWTIDTNVNEIRIGNRFGVFNVTASDASAIQLKNSMIPVSLDKNSIVDLMGSMKFRVAGSDTLRFYPRVDYEITPPPPTVCRNSTIIGYDFRDNNVNGMKDAGEPGLAGWIMRLKGKDSCTNTTMNRVTMTNAAGYFEFRNVTTGTYLISEKIPAGWIPTTPGVYKVIVPYYPTIIREDFGNIYYP